MAYPDLILWNDYGDFDPYIDAVYQCYIQDVVNAGLTFDGKPLSFRFNPMTQGKGSGFWHAVSEGASSGLEDDRNIDLPRCERIGWVAHVVQGAGANGGAGDIIWWRSGRGGRIRIVIWMQSENFAVVIEERQAHCQFVTCYVVTTHRAKGFLREHADYWAAQK